MARERHDRAHDMLGEEKRHAGIAREFGEGRDHGVDLGRTQTRHHLVEQQDLGLGGERARRFEALALGQREARAGESALRRARGARGGPAPRAAQR